MTEAAFAALMLVILGWAVISARLARWNITGPMVFTLAGFILANPDWGPSRSTPRRFTFLLR